MQNVKLQDIEACSCDVTSKSCDKYCCCDPSCPLTWKEMWRSGSTTNQCVDENIPEVNDLCAESLTMPQMTRARIMSKTAVNYVGDYSVMCIKTKSIPRMGFFYPITQIHNQDVLDQAQKINENTYLNTFTSFNQPYNILDDYHVTFLIFNEISQDWTTNNW